MKYVWKVGDNWELWVGMNVFYRLNHGIIHFNLYTSIQGQYFSF